MAENTTEAFTQGHVIVDLHRLTQDLTATSCLSPQEQAKADTFHFERDRHRYLECHARLRHQLSTLLDQEPESVELETDHYGKPFLPGFPLHFNISHAGPLYAAAFCRDHEIGIDVEVLPIQGKLIELTEYICHDDERLQLDSLATLSEREDQLLFYWTAKEAILKALGVGLQIEPKLLQVLGTPSDGHGHFASSELNAKPEHWQWHLLKDHPSHKLTLVLPCQHEARILFQQ